MPVSDLEIHRSAQSWIRPHGDRAVARAREMVEQVRCQGDEDGTDTRPRIIVAIGTQGKPATTARHWGGGGARVLAVATGTQGR